jgi:hypothetical protein
MMFDCFCSAVVSQSANVVCVCVAVLYQEAPKFNEKRRGTLTTVRRRVRHIPSVRTVFDGALPASATEPSKYCVTARNAVLYTN